MSLKCMANAGQEDNYPGRFFVEVNTRLRDLEEKHNLLREKVLLVGQSFVKERDKSFSEIQELKRTIEVLKSDNERFKTILSRIGEGVDKSARREELMILQRQFDLFRN